MSEKDELTQTLAECRYTKIGLGQGDTTSSELAEALLASDWLAEHDQKVAAKALMDAAQDSQMGPVSYGWSASGIAGWLRARAEQIEEGTGE